MMKNKKNVSRETIYRIGEMVNIIGTSIIGTIVDRSEKEDYYEIETNDGIYYEFGTRVQPARALDWVRSED